MSRPSRIAALAAAAVAVFTLASFVAWAAAPRGGGLVSIGCLGNAGSAGNNGDPGPRICSGANGLGQAAGVAVSPDGSNVYVASSAGNAVALFRRVAGGGLVQLGCLGNAGTEGNNGDPGPGICSGANGLSGAIRLAVSPDGANVYVVSPAGNAVALFRRVAGGGLVQLGCLGNAGSQGNTGRLGPGICSGANGLGGATGVAVSPDGANVYVVSPGSNAVALFRRVAGGGLVQLGCLGNAGSQGNNGRPGPGICSGANGLAGPYAVAVSPDGANVYVVSPAGNAVALFRRVAGGGLVQIGCLGNAGTQGNQGDPGPDICSGANGLGGATGVAVSPDGKNVYVASSATNALAVFRRVAGGGLVQIGCLGNAGTQGNSGRPGPGICSGANGLAGPYSVAVSPDGKNVYVASFSGNAVAVFRRVAGGGLVQIGCLGNAGTQGNKGDPGPGICSGANGLGNPISVAVTPDGKNVYVGSVGSNSVALFARAAFVPPVVSLLTVRPSRFTTARGTTFSYTLSEPAAVTFTIERKTSGGYSLVGKFSQQGVEGKNRNRFSGKVGKATLSPGSYRATLVATDLAGLKSQPKRVAFVVTRG